MHALRRVLSCVMPGKHRRPASCPHSCWCYFHRPFLQCSPPKRAVHRLGRGNKPRRAHCPSFLLVPQPPFLISSLLFRFQGGFRFFLFSPEFPPHLSLVLFFGLSTSFSPASWTSFVAHNGVSRSEESDHRSSPEIPEARGDCLPIWDCWCEWEESPLQHDIEADSFLTSSSE